MGICKCVHPVLVSTAHLTGILTSSEGCSLDLMLSGNWHPMIMMLLESSLYGLPMENYMMDSQSWLIACLSNSSGILWSWIHHLICLLHLHWHATAWLEYDFVLYQRDHKVKLVNPSLFFHTVQHRPSFYLGMLIWTAEIKKLKHHWIWWHCWHCSANSLHWSRACIVKLSFLTSEFTLQEPLDTSASRKLNGLDYLNCDWLKVRL